MIFLTSNVSSFKVTQADLSENATAEFARPEFIIYTGLEPSDVDCNIEMHKLRKLGPFTIRFISSRMYIKVPSLKPTKSLNSPFVTCIVKQFGIDDFLSK